MKRIWAVMGIGLIGVLMTGCAGAGGLAQRCAVLDEFNAAVVAANTSTTAEALRVHADNFNEIAIRAEGADLPDFAAALRETSVAMQSLDTAGLDVTMANMQVEVAKIKGESG